jgi:hypothetical protein
MQELIEILTPCVGGKDGQRLARESIARLFKSNPGDAFRNKLERRIASEKVRIEIANNLIRANPELNMQKAYQKSSTVQVYCNFAKEHIRENFRDAEQHISNLTYSSEVNAKIFREFQTKYPSFFEDEKASKDWWKSNIRLVNARKLLQDENALNVQKASSLVLAGAERSCGCCGGFRGPGSHRIRIKPRELWQQQRLRRVCAAIDTEEHRRAALVGKHN